MSTQGLNRQRSDADQDGERGLVGAKKNYQARWSGTSFLSTLPPGFAHHLGIEEGTMLDIALHPGGQEIPISEKCIIIRPRNGGASR